MAAVLRRAVDMVVGCFVWMLWIRLLVALLFVPRCVSYELRYLLMHSRMLYCSLLVWVRAIGSLCSGVVIAGLWILRHYWAAMVDVAWHALCCSCLLSIISDLCSILIWYTVSMSVSFLFQVSWCCYMLCYYGYDHGRPQSESVSALLWTRWSLCSW